MSIKIPKRCSSAILNAISSGGAPQIGLEYISVGRKKEVDAILADLNNIAEGGGAFRFFVGQYGSGKSFLLHLARNNAMERGYIVANVDLSPEKRLAGTKGQGLKMYRELISNLSTRTRPMGNAMESLLQKWITDLKRKVEKEGINENHRAYLDLVEEHIRETAAEMQNYAYGYDLAQVLLKYWQGYKADDEELMNSALQWLRGEYERKSEARLLGVSQIIGDDTWYDFIKLLARLSARIGYKGLLVLIDEEVNLYKINNRISRENNYDKLLYMFNDITQGRAEYIGIYICGTPLSIEDERRGLFSYEALKTRLQASNLFRDGLIDYSSPLIRLNTLTNEEIFVLLEHLHDVFCAHYNLDRMLTEDQMLAFMEQVKARLGAEKLLTPREISRDFVSLMNLLRQNPEETFGSILKSGKVKIEAADRDPDELRDNEFAAFDDL